MRKLIVSTVIGLATVGLVACSTPTSQKNVSVEAKLGDSYKVQCSTDSPCDTDFKVTELSLATRCPFPESDMSFPEFGWEEYPEDFDPFLLDEPPAGFNVLTVKAEVAVHKLPEKTDNGGDSERIHVTDSDGFTLVSAPTYDCLPPDHLNWGEQLGTGEKARVALSLFVPKDAASFVVQTRNSSTQWKYDLSGIELAEVAPPEPKKRPAPTPEEQLPIPRLGEPAPYVRIE